MAEQKVTYKELRSARVHYDNSVDTAKVYDIAADANIENMNVTNFDQGTVTKDGVQIAYFSCYGENNLSMNYQNVESANQCAILEAVNEFMTDVKANVASSSEIAALNI